jgi:hypothetical protein
MPWLVWVKSSFNSHIIGEKLQQNNTLNRAEKLRNVPNHFNVIIH